MAIRLRNLIVAALVAIAVPAFAQSPSDLPIPPFTTWDPTNALGTLNNWVVNDLNPNLTTSVSGATTTYPTHAILTSTATVPISGPATLSQQGFYASGDGGSATYVWNPASYCPGGTSGSPTAADGIVCILPSGQSASIAGRYLMQVGASIDVRSIGMQPSTPTSLFDDSPYVQALLTAQGPAPGGPPFAGMKTRFPSIPGQQTTVYYLKNSLDWSRNGPITCDRSPEGTVILAFDAGQDGLIADAYNQSPDGGSAWTQDTSGCALEAVGAGTAMLTNGSTAITTVSMGGYANGVAAPAWEIGDGIVASPSFWIDAPFAGSLLSTPVGDYVTAVGSGTLTLHAAAVFPSTATGYTPFTGANSTYKHAILRLPVEDAYTVNIAGPVTIAASGTWSQPTNVIPISNCIGVTLDAFVNDTSKAGSPSLGTVANCGGGNLTLHVNTAVAPSGSSDNLQFTSNIVLMTAGPQTIIDIGDFLWTDAYPLGAQVVGDYSTVSYVASGTITAPTLALNLSTPCPTTIAYPGLVLAVTSLAHVIDATTNTSLGYPASCVNVGGGSTLTLGAIPPGITVTSGDAISVPVYSTSRPVSTFAGHQTIIVGNRGSVATSTFVASATDSGGSMWKLPTGLSRRAPGTIHADLISGFFFGVKLSGSAGTFPTGGGSDSNDQTSVLGANWIGYLSSGDETAASSSLGMVYGNNHMYDVVEGGSLGSSYFNVNTNSAESGSAPGYGQVGECGSENFSSFFGGYTSTAPYTKYCLPADGTLNAPTYPPGFGGSVVFYSPQQSSPGDALTIGPQGVTGPFSFRGPAYFPSTPAVSGAAGSTTIGMAAPSSYYPGWGITDLNTQALSATTAATGSGAGSGTCTFTVNGGFTVGGIAPAQFSTTLSSGGITDPLTVVSNGNYVFGANDNGVAPKSTPVNPVTVTGTGGCSGLTGATVTVTYGSAIPSGATIASISPVANSLVISAPLQGAGVISQDPIRVTPTSAPSSVQISGGAQGGAGIILENGTGTLGNTTISLNGIYGGWSINGAISGTMEVFPDGTNDKGYQTGGFAQGAPKFPHGLTINNSANLTPGNERLIDDGAAVPTGTFHLQGDIRLNSTPVPAGNAGWVATSAFSTTLTGAVTKGSPISVSVAACPTLVLPTTGLLIVDTTPTPDVVLGTFHDCTTTTLTGTGNALNSGASSDTILFMQWQQVGIVQDSNLPAISSCGTGTPTVTAGSTNLAGQFTLGTGTPTACTITFAHAYPTAAFCTVTPASSGGAAITGGDYLSAMSKTGFTWTLGTGTSSLVFDYTCAGN